MWTDEQRVALCAAIDAGETVAYVVTDQYGRPSNGGRGTVCELGAVHTVEGDVDPCRTAVHGTLTPHRWLGCRVWIAVFHGVVRADTVKIAARSRTIIGEVMPEDCIDAQVAVRIGWRIVPHCDLDGAILDGASLVGASLVGASLVGASLNGTLLNGASLSGASFHRARLNDAILDGTTLVGASLVGATINGASLVGANLDGASLVGASLLGSSLNGATLDGATLDGATFNGAFLDGASINRASMVGASFYRARLNDATLDGTTLDGATLDGAYRPTDPPPGWVPNENGYLRRAT